MWSLPGPAMAELELALAASARTWADALHRFLTDHGGARVRAVVMGPEEVVGESYDVLLIDDVCSFLTPRLVEEVRRSGRAVVGVFEARDGVDAKRRLLDCGVDDVVESDASPEEFLDVIGRVRELMPPVPVLPLSTEEPVRRGRLIAVGAPPGGCGSTEISVGLAASMGALLVDADDVAPSVAQRLGIPMHPNLRTAIDVVHHRTGSLDEAITESGSLRIVAGLANGEDWAQLHPGEVHTVMEELAAAEARVVVNIGAGLERPQVGEGRFGLARQLVSRADVIVGVGLPHPVAMARLVNWLAEADALASDARLVTVVNRVSRSIYQKGEVAAELSQAVPGIPIVMVPEDRRVTEAAWSGTPVGRGPFRRAMRRLAREVEG